MERIEALKELAEKVEAGELLAYHSVICIAFEVDNIERFMRALHGSLDAAKALHDAVLPGWQVKRISERKNKALWFVCLEPLPYLSPQEGATSTTPARAWLLAIIRALIAQEANAKDN